MIIESTSVRQNRSPLTICLSVLLMLSWFAPSTAQFEAPCGMAASPEMTAASPTRSQDARVEPVCPATSMPCEMTAACCATCPAVFAAPIETTLEHSVTAVGAFTALDLRPRNRSASALDPPPRA